MRRRMALKEIHHFFRNTQVKPNESNIKSSKEKVKNLSTLLSNMSISVINQNFIYLHSKSLLSMETLKYFNYFSIMKLISIRRLMKDCMRFI